MSSNSNRRNIEEAQEEEVKLSIDVEKTSMQPMQISTGSSHASLPSIAGANGLSGLISKGGFALVLLTIIVLVSIFAFPAVTTSETAAAAHLERPSDLRGMLKKVTAAAVSSGALVPMIVSPPVEAQQDGMKFYVSYLTSSGKPRGGSSGGDVFAAHALEPALVVAAVPPMHTLVLNKYSTFRDHALLVTNQFEKQADMLSVSDMEAWYWAISAAQAAGFYNSGPAAGASQPHKHMQLIPLDRFKAARDLVSSESSSIYSLPIDDVVMPHITSLTEEIWTPFDPFSSSAKGQIHTLDQFRFVHGFVVLLEAADWAAKETEASRHQQYSYSDYLHTAYLLVLRALKMTNSDCAAAFGTQHSSDDHQACVPYNMILTNRWMLVVPRSKGASSSGLVSVNGFGFIGFLLTQNSSSLETLRYSVGPLTVLQDVSFSGE